MARGEQYITRRKLVVGVTALALSFGLRSDRRSSAAPTLPTEPTAIVPTEITFQQALERFKNLTPISVKLNPNDISLPYDDPTPSWRKNTAHVSYGELSHGNATPIADSLSIQVITNFLFPYHRQINSR